MRPYRRRYHSSWRTRTGRGLAKTIYEFLEPFIYSTKTIWRMEPPFPLTAKPYGQLKDIWNEENFSDSVAYSINWGIGITVITWFLLFLPLCYFLVPPLVVLLLLNYFSLRIDVEGFLTRVGEKLARLTWPEKFALPFRKICSSNLYLHAVSFVLITIGKLNCLLTCCSCQLSTDID